MFRLEDTGDRLKPKSKLVHSPQLLLPLVKAKDQAGSSQEWAMSLDVAKKSSMGEWSSAML